MSNFSEFLDDDSNDLDGEIVLNIETIRSNLGLYDSEKLCEMIICHRYLGFSKEVAVMCMEELSRRRTAGDNFNFEVHIEQALAELPKLDFTAPDIRTIFSSLNK